MSFFNADNGIIINEHPLNMYITNPEKGCRNVVELLDLSDDVLLCILRYCSPMDLKALGYSCSRLGMLIRDHTLWVKVDAREQPCGPQRFQWFLDYTLNDTTEELLLSGFAKDTAGCFGHIKITRQEAASKIENKRKYMLDTLKNYEFLGSRLFDNTGNDDESDDERNVDANANQGANNMEDDFGLNNVFIRQHARQHIIAHHWHSFSNITPWIQSDEGFGDELATPDTCPGPQFTLSRHLLRQLRTQCTNLTSLALDFCNINYKATKIRELPPTLKKLSLRGSQCFSLPLDRTFLLKISDYLPELEYIDLSECDWLEPASFLPLSKIPNLRHLVMRHCPKMSEFIAYSSLASRYGFKKLEILDLRGTPVSDSEVSGLGWLPMLQELYLAPPAEGARRVPQHAHYKGDTTRSFTELRPWELRVPVYYQTTFSPDGSIVNEDLCDESNSCLKRKTEEKNTFSDGTNDANNRFATSSKKKKSENDDSGIGLAESEKLKKQPEGCSDNEQSDFKDSPPKTNFKHKPKDYPSFGDSYKSEGDSSDDNNDDSPKKKRKMCDVVLKKEPDELLSKNEMDPASNNGDVLTCQPNRHVIAVVLNSSFPSASSAQGDVESNDTGGLSTSKKETYVKFRRNEDPVVVSGDTETNSKAMKIDFDNIPSNMGNTLPNNRTASNSEVFHNGNVSESEKSVQSEDCKTNLHDLLIDILSDSPTCSNVESQKSHNSDDKSQKENDIKGECNDSKPISYVKFRVNQRPIVVTNECCASSSEQQQNVETKSDNGHEAAKLLPGDRKGGMNYIKFRVNQSPVVVTDEPCVVLSSAQQNVETGGDNCQHTKSEADDKTSCVSKPISYVKFRVNQRPVLVTDEPCASSSKEKNNKADCDDGEDPKLDQTSKCSFKERNSDALPQDSNERSKINETPPTAQQGTNTQNLPPRHRVLYVNIRNRVLAVDAAAANGPSTSARYRNNSHSSFVGIDRTTLVTNSSVRNFGRSDDDVNVMFRLDPAGLHPPTTADVRPSRSSLRVLSVTGYRHIDDRSLVHLATAAPHLRLIDFSRTSVTAAGVELFRSLRPDCEVIYTNEKGETNTEKIPSKM